MPPSATAPPAAPRKTPAPRKPRALPPRTQPPPQQSMQQAEVHVSNFGEALRAAFLALVDACPTSTLEELATRCRVPVEQAAEWLEGHSSELAELSGQRLREWRVRQVNLIAGSYEDALKRQAFLLKGCTNLRAVSRAVSTLGTEFRLWNGMATEIVQGAKSLSDEDLARELFAAYREAGLPEQEAWVTVNAYMKITTTRLSPNGTVIDQPPSVPAPWNDRSTEDEDD